MGTHKRRVSPKIANRVNRNLKSLMVHSLVDIVMSLPSPWEQNKMGRPCRNPKIVAICWFLKIFWNQTYDGIEAELRDSNVMTSILGCPSLPGHSVIARGGQKLPVSYIRRVNRLMVFRLRRKGMNVAVDSSGFGLKTSSSWFDIRIRRVSRRKDHVKLHIVIDVETLTILHFTITGWKRNDSREFKRLISSLPKLGKVFADKAYSSRENCQFVVDRNGTPYIPFKKNASGMAKRHPAWKISFRQYKSNNEAWMDEYHIRSVVESVFSSIKRCWKSSINTKLGWQKWKILATRVLAYNTKRMLYIEEAERLGVPLWI